MHGQNLNQVSRLSVQSYSSSQHVVKIPCLTVSRKFNSWIYYPFIGLGPIFRWQDTAGQERFHALGPIYYRDSHGAILVYDITDEDSFEKVFYGLLHWLAPPSLWKWWTKLKFEHRNSFVWPPAAKKPQPFSTFPTIGFIICNLGEISHEHLIVRLHYCVNDINVGATSLLRARKKAQLCKLSNISHKDGYDHVCLTKFARFLVNRALMNVISIQSLFHIWYGYQ